MEFNKIFAGFLIGGIVLMCSGFVANGIMGGVHGDEHAKNAYHIDIAVAETVDGASDKPKDMGIEPVADLLASADLAKGKKRSKACISCHSFDKGGKNKTGPNLWNIVGKKIASDDSFTYSSAMKEKTGVWDYDTLNKFLAKPKKFMPGTKMTYAGMKKVKDRAALIAWMRSMSDAPVDLP